jgi:hypothetical protein
MKKIAFVIVVCACILTPAAARADDGGFWDMLFHWDTKFFGYGTEFHLVCRTASNKRVENCEEQFRNFRLRYFRRPSTTPHFFTVYENGEARAVRFEEIKHELNFRVSYMHSYGQRIPDAKLAPDDPLRNDTRKIHAVRALALYTFRANKWLDLAAGGGIVPLFGDDVHRVWRGVFSGGLVFALAGGWYARTDLSYYTNTITGADFGHPTSSMVIKPKPNASFTIGVDLRRVGIFNAAPSR